MRYQVGGSLQVDDPTYIIRQADEQIYAALEAGMFCYVLTCCHSGKTSLLLRTKYRLEQKSYACAYLNFGQFNSLETTPVQWYKSFIVSLFYELNLEEQVNFNSWWQQQAKLSPVQRLHQFVVQILLNLVKSERIIIFIDQVESLLNLSFPVNDFFGWIHHCYNQQAYDPDFKRLGFVVSGVASPSELITDQRPTPFNIGQAIELYGFQLHEATPLLKGLERIITQPTVVLQEIVHHTGGQPFLTQKICRLVVQLALDNSRGKIIIPTGAEGFWIERLVQTYILNHWQSQDEPEHLRTIRHRLLSHQGQAKRLLTLYQQVLSAQLTDTQPSFTLIDDSQEQTKLLLSGLVEKHNGYIKVQNPIYRNVFNSQWVIRELNNLHSHS